MNVNNYGENWTWRFVSRRALTFSAGALFGASVVVFLGALGVILFQGCDRGGAASGDNPGECDDGSELTCMMEKPECEEHEVVAVQDNCYVCVNPDTCEPWGIDECSDDSDCAFDEYCNPCGTSSCPGCEDCVPACTDHGCDTEDTLECDGLRPECGDEAVAVVKDGCWVCVDLVSCEPTEPARDESCDDGTEPTCNMVEPECEEHEILAYQDNCYVCVNPVSCKPWGEPGCETDVDCGPEDFCNPCGTASCPMCLDCVPACVPHNCETEEELMCFGVRYDCGESGVAVIRDGCWVCVDINSCEPIEPTRDDSCDDGTEPICEMVPPVCEEHEILAYQNSCYVCVNPVSCKPWGEPGCEGDVDCGPTDYCAFCATSSCPMCDDCIAACIPHNCETEEELMCFGVRDECGDDGVAIIEEGCWECVDLDTCEPMY